MRGLSSTDVVRNEDEEEDYWASGSINTDGQAKSIDMDELIKLHKNFQH